MANPARSDEYKVLLLRLKKARVDAGLSQAEVAEKLGKHQSYISKVESGERRLDVIEVKKIAAVYKIDVSELIS